MFECQNYLRNAVLPPLRSNLDSFEFENLLTAEDPLGQTSEKGYQGIFTLKMSNLFVFIFIFWRVSERNL